MTRPLSHTQFDVIDVNSAGLSGKHYRWADVEVYISNGQEDLLASALRWPSWRSRHVTGIWYSKERPGANQRVTLQVRMPVLACWCAAFRWEVIRRRVIGKLDKAGIGYAVIQVETGGLVYLPRVTSQRHDH